MFLGGVCSRTQGAQGAFSGARIESDLYKRKPEREALGKDPRVSLAQVRGAGLPVLPPALSEPRPGVAQSPVYVSLCWRDAHTRTSQTHILFPGTDLIMCPTLVMCPPSTHPTVASCELMRYRWGGRYTPGAWEGVGAVC